MYDSEYTHYGFNKFWGHHNDVDRFGAGGCHSCMGGKVGCGNSTYHNNKLLGTPERPVLFTDLKRICIDCEEIDVLIADREFFDRLRFDCTFCREFFASICTCIEFGDTRPVFISDDPCCKRLLPLETSRNGFLIHADQIQPFADSMKLLRMTACFDHHNDHVTVSNYYKRHARCGCDQKFDKRFDKVEECNECNDRNE